jgi:hypothetical protein
LFSMTSQATDNQATKKQKPAFQATKYQKTKCRATRGEATMSRVANAYGFRLARQPHRSGRIRNLAAESLFFVEVFGLSSIAMGGAMLLAAAYSHRTQPAEVRVEADVLPGGDDAYLQMFAAGPACSWYIAPGAGGNVRSCDGQRNASPVDGAGD